MTIQDEQSNAVPPRRRPFTVNVFGAGIAGLTVAHELAERGFKVRVIERDASVDRHGHARISVGGVARTQYAVAPAPGDAPPAAGAWTARACTSDKGDGRDGSSTEGYALWKPVVLVRDLKLAPVHAPFECAGAALAPGARDELLP